MCLIRHARELSWIYIDLEDILEIRDLIHPLPNVHHAFDVVTHGHQTVSTTHANVEPRRTTPTTHNHHTVATTHTVIEPRRALVALIDVESSRDVGAHSTRDGGYLDDAVFGGSQFG
ncbi:hypothetical protein C2S51_004809 [Perilla frutescens var. frutescens]|nr:hypothetical protein C2S51_004809 [Perilla frutescens var. frutescens]